MRARRSWLRLANPARRLAVTWRYGGSRAALELARQRYRELRPPQPESSADAFEPLAVQATAPPTIPRKPLAGAPAVSVIVRTHNRPALLEQALTSLANQTFDDFEVVLVNDGDVDVSPVVERLAPYLYIRQADHDAGRGRTVALNSGLAITRGRCITYLDDDDILYPMHLARLFAALKDRKAQAVYADANRALCWSDQQQTEIVLRMACASLDFDPRRLLVDNWIASVAFMHDAACIEQVGLFDEAFEPFEDWEFLLRLGSACTFAHVPEITYEYRIRFGPMPQDTQSALRQRERVLAATERIYARYPTTDGELQARRQLTLAALRQDIEQASRIEQTSADPLQRDLRLAALSGRFPVSRDLLHRFTTTPR